MLITGSYFLQTLVPEAHRNGASAPVTSMLHMFYCSVDNNTNSNFLELCVCVLYSGFGKATRGPDLGNCLVFTTSSCFLIELHPFLFVMQGGNLLPPLPCCWQSQDRPTGAGKVPLWQNLLFAAWVVCPQQESDVGHQPWSPPGLLPGCPCWFCSVLPNFY